MKTDRGFLVTMRSKDRIGLLMPCEWLYRTEEAAQSCLDVVIQFEAVWRAMTNDYPMDAAMKKLEQKTQAHTVLCERLNEKPLIGHEVQNLRS
ncbi:MAG: hypothetical protein ACHQF3_03660 [Alphaproteobacteria bacterium]